MITKEELKQYRSLTNEIENLNEKIVRLRSQLELASTQIMTGMPHGSDGEVDKIGKALSILEEAQKRYYDKLIEITELTLKIEKAIENLTPTERLLIRYRYMDFMKWEDICSKLKLSWKQSHNLHKKILRKFEMGVDFTH